MTLYMYIVQIQDGILQACMHPSKTTTQELSQRFAILNFADTIDIDQSPALHAPYFSTCAPYY